MNSTKGLIDAITSDDVSKANIAFEKAIKEKVNVVLDIKKVAITTEIYNKANK